MESLAKMNSENYVIINKYRIYFKLILSFIYSQFGY